MKAPIFATRLFTGLLVLSLYGLVDPAKPQTASPSGMSPFEAIKQRDRELDKVQEDVRDAITAQKNLKAEIDTIKEDRSKLNQSLIEAASQVRSIENRIAETEDRIQQFGIDEEALRKSLSGRRAAITEIFATLQRIGRRPPPAILVKPEDALAALRTAMLLGVILPEMKNETEQLAADLESLARIRKETALQRDSLRHDLAAIMEEKARMALLIDERQKQEQEVTKALESERQRVQDLSRQAVNLKELISGLEQVLDSANRSARAAARATAEGSKLGETRPDLTALKDPGRLAPGIAFALAKGQLTLPVNGVKVRDFGAQDGFGGTEQGISLATRPGAQVTSPADGWVVYEGPYRSYGQLLILNAGGGYHIVLAGMERVSVDLGQFVLSGEPVGIMANGPFAAASLTAGNTGSSQPVLYIEFRKNGTPVDPSPWWVTTDIQKVRG